MTTKYKTNRKKPQTDELGEKPKHPVVLPPFNSWEIQSAKLVTKHQQCFCISSSKELLKGAIPVMAYAGDVSSAPELDHKQDKLRQTLSQKPSGAGDSSQGRCPVLYRGDCKGKN